MKNNFPGFYNPTDSELKVLWNEGIFVLDSSVLLRLYEVPDSTQRETFAALKKLGGRLWVPHQAALEYQRNRARTIGIAKNRVAEALDPMEAALRTFVQSANSIKLADRGHEDAIDRLKVMEAAGEEVIVAARAAIASHVDINGEDPVRDQLNALLKNKVGEPPKQEDLTRWNAEAERRYTHRMGPGHLDQGKSKNPTYMMDGLIFDKRFADLYVWKETIAYASDDSVHSVVMITNDNKPDWWKTTENGVVGPLPELCSEIRSEAKLTNFWMYDLKSFLREAGKRLNVSVSGTTLSDVSESLDKIDVVPGGANSWAKFHSNSLDSLRSGDIYKTLSKYSKKALSDIITVRGYVVLNSTGSTAVGFNTADGSLAVAMLAHGSESSIDEVVSEIAPALIAGSARKFELYLLANSTVASLESYRVANRVINSLAKHGVSDVALKVYSGSSDEMALALEADL